MMVIEAEEGMGKSNGMNFSEQGTWIGALGLCFWPGVEGRLYGCFEMDRSGEYASHMRRLE